MVKEEPREVTPMCRGDVKEKLGRRKKLDPSQIESVWTKGNEK